MPIVGPTSYFAVTQSFINHWTDANAANGGVAILLDKVELEAAADVPVASLAALLVALEAQRDVVEDVAQDVPIKRAFAAGLREFLLVKMVDFNEKMRADHGTSPYAANLSAVPSASAGREAFMKPMRDTSRLWAKVNTWRVAAGKPALEIKGGVTVDAFNSALSTTRVALDELEEREQQFGIELAKRNGIQAQIYPILRVYRLKIPTVFADGSPLISSLPKLTPDAGSTPEAPGLSMGWDVAGSAAEGVGTASPSGSVVQYQLRGCPQADFENDIEVVIATVEAGQPLEFETTWGLTLPGATASFRLVAMTEDGHERGSTPVVVTRPL